jgi:hypothetical protein
MSTFKPGPPHPIQVGNFDLFADYRRREQEEASKERIKQEEIEKRSIYPGSPQTAETLQADLISGKGRWKILGQLEREKAEARKQAKREGEELVMAPEPEFDKEDE